MDMDDDDAFLYGDEEEISQPTTAAPVKDVKPDTSLSASMAASLAAYGIDPTTAVAAENPEDGGVEEEDPEDEDEDSDSDEDDIKVVFNTGAQRLDLRKPQTQPSNIIGVGKWAHTSTGAAAPAVATPTAAPATPRVIQPTANQTTEYTPTSRPGTTSTPAPTSIVQAPLVNPAIPPSGDEGTAPNIALPSSSLPPITSHSTFKIDPENPSGIIPSTGNSTYDIDVAQFEGSGQPWRRPGSDIQDWFNFGFDEVTYPKFLRYRQEMEIGRAALMNMPMGGMNPEIAQMLHLPNPMMTMNMGNMNQMNQMAQLNQMGQMAQMGQMGNMPFNSQQMQAMQQQMGMGGMGMDGMMMQQQQQQQFQQQQQQMQGQQGPHGPGQLQGQPSHQRSVSQRMSATPAPGQTGGEGGEEVKQEEGVDNATTVPEPTSQTQRGQVPLRGMPAGRGTAMRGRGGAIPSGPRAAAALPANIPKGPKAGRFKDKDRVENATSDLNYGDEESSYPVSNPNTGGGAASQDNSPTKSDRRSRSRRQRERSYDEGYDSRDSYRSERSASPGRERERDRDRSRRSSRRNRDKDEDEYEVRERERDKGDKKKDKRKREEGGGSGNVLGPGGWETDEEEVRPRRKKSYDSEEEDRYARRSKRR